MPPAPDYRLVHLQGLLGDQYRFETVLGQGGAAVVYQVTNLRLNRFEAMKVLNPAPVSTPNFGGRFTQEAKLAATLDHPNIVKVYDFGIDEGVFWYSMQYIEGPTLDAVAHSRGLLSDREVTTIAVPLLDALDYVHRRGIVHRDVKPGNIILDASGRPYLMDFGIAKTEDSLKRTQTGVMVGTPAYLPPEVVAGSEPDGRSDIYSLGVTFYELVAGKMPFPCETTVQAIFSRLNSEPVPLSERREGLNPDFQAIIMRSLERDPAKRFATAADMRDGLMTIPALKPEPIMLSSDALARLADIRRSLTGQDVTVVPGPARPARPQKWRRAALAGLVLLGLSAAAAGFLWLGRGAGGDFRERQPVPPTAGPGLPRPPAAAGRRDAAPALPAGRLTAAPGPTTGPGESKPPAPSDRKPAPAAVPAGAPAAPGPGAGGPPPGRPYQMPRLLQDSPVLLPEGLADNCRGLTVGVSVTVGENGQVKAARLISTVAPECGREALAAVRRYVYLPAQDVQGRPVETTIAVSIRLE